jgi:hypothetical protein
MKQLELFKSSERLESGEDYFDISKIQFNMKPDTMQRSIMLSNISRINALPSDTYVLYKTGGFHRNTIKYSDPVYPYLYDYSNNKSILVQLTRCEYPTICIPTKYTDKKTLNMVFHRLIAMCFLPNDEPNYKITVDHLDGDKKNYSLSNLEWVTSSENQIRKGKNT